MYRAIAGSGAGALHSNHLGNRPGDGPIGMTAGAGGEPGGQGPLNPGEEGGTGTTRLGTLLPLLRTFLQIVVTAMAVMIGLAGLGVNIGALLAGVGIVGNAIGFGSQTLVRDIVSGVFFLVDDSFRLGEYIDVGPVKGTVERISIRSMQIRHRRGALHTIPFGEIKRLTNYSRELGPHILQPLKSQGLMDVRDGALIMRAKIKVRPDDTRCVIRREVLSRIKRALEGTGIHFAPRQVTVHVAQPSRAPAGAPTPADRNTVPAGVAGGAAAAILASSPARGPAPRGS